MGKDKNTHWNTDEIVSLIKENVSGDYTVKNSRLGEDYTTQCVSVSVTECGDTIKITGFNTSECIESASDAEIEFVELRDTASDSNGGLQSTCRSLRIVGLDIELALKKAGYSVVPQLRDWF